MINFREINENNFWSIIKMKRPENEKFVAPNAISLAEAWLYRANNDVFPKAIYNDDEIVGFLLLDEDLEERTLMVWRILFPTEHMNKGYGTEAIKLVIKEAKETGKYSKLKIDYVIGNEIAKHVYEKCGFIPTGEVEDNEIVMELKL